jgi:hypothetical protein
MVSSEDGYDFLELWVDGVRRSRVSEFTDWQKMNYRVLNGKHALKWRYTKDESAAWGGDCGWVDRVQFTPDPVATPTPTSTPTPSPTPTEIPSSVEGWDLNL